MVKQKPHDSHIVRKSQAEPRYAQPKTCITHQPTKESLTPGLSLYLRPDPPLGNLRGKHSYKSCLGLQPGRNAGCRMTPMLYSVFITFHNLVELMSKNMLSNDSFESHKLDLYKTSNMP